MALCDRRAFAAGIKVRFLGWGISLDPLGGLSVTTGLCKRGAGESALGRRRCDNRGRDLSDACGRRWKGAQNQESRQP